VEHERSVKSFLLEFDLIHELIIARNGQKSKGLQVVETVPFRAAYRTSPQDERGADHGKKYQRVNKQTECNANDQIKEDKH
jgi:hypothetical protein